METKANMNHVPKLRFPGFYGEWEEKALGEVFVKNEERNKDGSIGYDKTISVASMTYKPAGNGAADASLRTYKVLRIGDIAFEGHTSKDYAYGRFVMNDLGVGLMSPRFTALRPKEDVDVDFWKELIHYEPVMRSILLKSTKMGTMMNELIVADFLKQPLLVPSPPEQKSIAKCLLALSSLISAQEQIIESLKIQKQGLMQQLFPRSGETIPRLRFPGFTGEWEEKKMSDVFTRITRRNTENNQNVLTISAQYGLISQLDFFKKSVAAADVTGYYLLKKGEFAYNKSSSQRKPFGAIKPLRLYDKGVVSTLYICFKCNNSREIDFWEQYFDAGLPDKEIMSIAQEGARNHGLLNVSSTEFFSLKVFSPSDADEQQKIASCLSALDDTILAETDKLESLKAHKKGLMQQLFPQPTK